MFHLLGKHYSYTANISHANDSMPHKWTGFAFRFFHGNEWAFI